MDEVIPLDCLRREALAKGMTSSMRHYIVGQIKLSKRPSFYKNLKMGCFKQDLLLWKCHFDQFRA